MLLTLNDKPIKRVAVVNDTAAARDEMAENIFEAGLEPVIHSSRLNSIDECIATITSKAEAAILEHHFKSDHYANFMGAEAVARLYRQHFPSLLVTAWADADIDNIRLFRRYIPVLVESGHAESEIITQGFKQCINEFENHYSPDRRPWRTLIRIEEIDRVPILPMVYALVPGWDPRKIVKFPLSLIPENLQPTLETEPHLFAKVNIGAAHHDELYFTEFEVAEKPGGEW
ncbi:MAG: hypothetical protein DRR08_11915 [Candidatus Parabeggiatoa sp. nov. 2]|nr:MAG: hypothetical protein B6247_15265 [Beggiatoa sp. 4572_84]RKZ60228.1 MAG: hypothetical protein DRR08_11915 [Gammaproteobacteria bacterium]HEC84801.1 hypothetical protein [Thioploca sp.]